MTRWGRIRELPDRWRWALMPWATVVTGLVLWWYGPYRDRWGYCEVCGRGRTSYSTWWIPLTDTVYEDDFVRWLASDVPEPHVHTWRMYDDECRVIPFGPLGVDCAASWPPHEVFRYRREFGDEVARDLVRLYREARLSGDRSQMRDFHAYYYRCLQQAEVLAGE